MPPKPPPRRPSEPEDHFADPDFARIVRLLYVDVRTGAIVQDWRGHSARRPQIPPGHVRIEVPNDDTSYAGQVWDRSNGFLPGVPDTSSSDQPTMTAVTFRRQFSPEEWQKLRGMLTGD